MAWILCDGRRVAHLEVADTFGTRLRGLMGRDFFEDAILITRASSVHTFRMRFPIDVAYLDVNGFVVDTLHMMPNRLSRPRRRARSVVEASLGSFDKWGIKPGSRLEVKV
jgi:uncharacterized protein